MPALVLLTLALALVVGAEGRMGLRNNWVLLRAAEIRRGRGRLRRPAVDRTIALALRPRLRLVPVHGPFLVQSHFDLATLQPGRGRGRVR